MTMIESCLLSAFSASLMIWETMKRTDLIKREATHLNLDKVELMEEDEVNKGVIGGVTGTEGEDGYDPFAPAKVKNKPGPC